MIGKSSPKYILGYTSDETVMLDFDDTKLKDVFYWSRRALKRFDLGGFIVLESSPGCYHVIFNRVVNWSKNIQVVAWVALLSNKMKLRRWFLLQCIKQKSTLRVSEKHELNKGVKPSPEIVWFEGSQDGEISEFLKYRKMILNLRNIR